MSPARLAARCLELLGPIEGPIAVMGWGPLRTALAERAPLAENGTPAAAAVCVFLREPAAAPARQRRLHDLAARLPAGAPIVVVDHNQPRQRIARLIGATILLASGAKPTRAAYPTARELQANGFAIDRLRLTAGERIQLVVARRS